MRMKKTRFINHYNYEVPSYSQAYSTLKTATAPLGYLSIHMRAPYDAILHYDLRGKNVQR